jgi:proteasome accessory factor C
MSADSAISPGTVVRFLKLIRLLKGRPGKTLAQLGTLLGCSSRNARRYVNALEEAGFLIDSIGKRPPRYFLAEDERREQARFTEEEAQLVQVALANVPDGNLLLGTLRQKIYEQSLLFPLAERLVELHKGQIVAQLHEAIRERRQVRLLRYNSLNSGTISDRLVEPHSFSDDFAQLTAYDPEAGRAKTFNTVRIDDVEALDSPQEHPPTEAPVDAFRWPGEPVRITLSLTQTAHRLMLEDHPFTRPDLHHVPTDVAFPYRFAGYVRSWVGVGRFVLGQPGQVRIDDAPESFRTYLRGRVAEFDL